MNFRTVLAVYAVLGVIGGAFPLIATPFAMSLYGYTSPDAVSLLLYRIFAATTIGVGIIAWMLRSVGDASLRNSLAVAFAVMSALQTVVLLLGVRGSGLNATTWLPTATYAIFAVIFAILARPAMSAKPVAPTTS